MNCVVPRCTPSFFPSTFSTFSNDCFWKMKLMTFDSFTIAMTLCLVGLSIICMERSSRSGENNSKRLDTARNGSKWLRIYEISMSAMVKVYSRIKKPKMSQNSSIWLETSTRLESSILSSFDKDKFIRTMSLRFAQKLRTARSKLRTTWDSFSVTICLWIFEKIYQFRETAQLRISRNQLVSCLIAIEFSLHANIHRINGAFRLNRHRMYTVHCTCIT